MASSRLMEFVPHTVCRVLARRKFQYFVVPLKVMVSCRRILRSRIGSQDLMISGNKTYVVVGSVRFAGVTALREIVELGSSIDIDFNIDNYD